MRVGCVSDSRITCRFGAIAEVYRVVAEDTVLGQEQTGMRARGTSVDDVVAVMREGIKSKKEKSE